MDATGQSLEEQRFKNNFKFQSFVGEHESLVKKQLNGFFINEAVSAAIYGQERLLLPVGKFPFKAL